MFTGIDEVDWASLHHAYGSAEDVPGWLRGLASADPAERGLALDRMYGAVHHQGDVYDSTLACVPFLFALAGSEEVRDRGGIVELLVSIGLESQGREADGTYASAGIAVRARAGLFAALSGDPDASVRRTAAVAVVRFVEEPARVLDLLRQRITVERDDRVLLALAESLGLFVRRHPAQSAQALELLVAQSAAPYGPGLRLAALGQLAGCAPDRLPSDLVPLTVRLLRERSAGRLDVTDGPGSDTLVGRLRRLRPSDEEGSQLLRTLHQALDDRVGDRIALLEGQLTCPDATDRCNAVWMSAGLMREWRADCSGLVALIGAQLGAAEDRLRDAAVSVLTDLFELAGPAADDLVALVSSRPDLWVRRWERGAPVLGGPLKALARSGDPRAVPVLAEVLAEAVVPRDLGQAVRCLGRNATPLALLVRRRLGEIPLNSPETSARAVPLLSALVALRDAATAGAGEALPEVLRLVRGAPVGLRSGDAYVGCLVRAVGSFGSAAREAVPVLRGLLDTEYTSAAARALWEMEGDPTVVLPVLLRELEAEEPRRRRSAAEALSRMGGRARPAAAALRRATSQAGHPWERATAAGALWRIDGDAETVLPVLRAVWSESPYTRGTVAECLVEMRSAGAPLQDLLETELSARRRHLALPGGHSSHDIRKDERLLRLCREALTGG